MDFKTSWVGGFVIALSSACTTPSDSNETTDPTTSGPGSSSTVTITTIQLTSGIDSGGSSSGTAGSSEDGPSSSGADTTTSTTTGPDDTTGTTTAAEESSTGPAFYEVTWCILQYPPDVMVGVDEPFTAYVRFYAGGLTDQTGGNDPSPQLMVEFGYGEDGSDPSMGAVWTYVPGGPNVGWGPGAPGYSPDNDEYQGDLSIPMAGVYDYAARISGDGGMTWVHCDLDDLINGGYTPDQAGHAEVGEVL